MPTGALVINITGVTGSLNHCNKQRKSHKLVLEQIITIIIKKRIPEVWPETDIEAKSVCIETCVERTPGCLYTCADCVTHAPAIQPSGRESRRLE